MLPSLFLPQKNNVFDANFSFATIASDAKEMQLRMVK